MAKQGWEFFYVDDDGNKADRDMHALILGVVDKRKPPVDEEIMAPIRERHRQRWLAEQEKRRQWRRAKALAILSRPCG